MSLVQSASYDELKHYVSSLQLTNALNNVFILPIMHSLHMSHKHIGISEP